jgi:hypothetical protein
MILGDVSIETVLPEVQNKFTVMQSLQDAGFQGVRTELQSLRQEAHGNLKHEMFAHFLSYLGNYPNSGLVSPVTRMEILMPANKMPSGQGQDQALSANMAASALPYEPPKSFTSVTGDIYNA